MWKSVFYAVEKSIIYNSDHFHHFTKWKIRFLDHILIMAANSNRKLLKIKLRSEPFKESFLQQKLADASIILGVSEEAASYFVFTGEADNTMYNIKYEEM